MSNVAIKIEGLTKSYETVKAVDDISLKINKGELFGLIGPDGAGKTTTMRIMCGLLSLDAGTASLMDFDVVKNVKNIRKIIGYMPQRFSLYPDLSVAENLRFFADLFQVSSKERKERTERLLQFSKLGPFQKRRANDLSGGMKQKLALSCTLIHTPEVLILDEPTTGVDPVSRREFWQILHELVEDGVTIFVSTPYMDEAMQCNRVALMHQGKLMAVDKPDQLGKYFSNELLEITSPDLHQTMATLEQVPVVLSAQLFGDKIHVTVANAISAKDKLQNNGYGISTVKIIEPGLEDIFIDLMSK